MNKLLKSVVVSFFLLAAFVKANCVNWDNSNTYGIGESVIYNGKYFKTIRNLPYPNTPPSGDALSWFWKETTSCALESTPSPIEPLSYNLSDYGGVNTAIRTELEAKYNGITAVDVQFEEALRDCKDGNGTLFIPNGSYTLHHPLDLVDIKVTLRICHIIGQSKNATKIYFDSNDPDHGLFNFDLERINFVPGDQTSVRMKNLSLYSNQQGKFSAIRLVGSNASIFENILIKNFENGLYLLNSKPGIYNELNTFRNIRIDYATNAIHQDFTPSYDENGRQKTDLSFHGNIYDPIFINIKEGQSGFKNTGYYYNGRFNLFMWTHGKEHGDTFLIDNAGYSPNNIGNITYETYSKEPGCSSYAVRPAIRATGSKAYFLFTGSIQSPNSDYLNPGADGSCSSYGRSDFEDLSNGRVVWSEDTRFESYSEGKPFSPGQNTQVYTVHNTYHTGTTKGYTGVFNAHLFADEPDNIISHRRATIIIPGDRIGRRPFVVDESGWDYAGSSALLRCKILPHTGVNDFNWNLGHEKKFDVWCDNKTNKTINVNVKLKRAN